MRKAFIYKIENLENGKFYIGSTVNPIHRYNSHFSSLNLNKHHSTYLQNSYNKYGKHSFKFTILLKCYEQQQYIIEQEYIDKLNPHYNLNKVASKPPVQKGKTWKCRPEAVKNIRESVKTTTKRIMHAKLNSNTELINQFISGNDTLRVFSINNNIGVWQLKNLVALYCNTHNIDYSKIKSKKLSAFNIKYTKEDRLLIYKSYLKLKDTYSDRQIIKLKLLPMLIGRNMLISIKKEHV